MKIQEVILKAMAGKLKWWEAAEIIEVTDRTMRRWRQQYEGARLQRFVDYRKRSEPEACTGGGLERCCGCTESSISTSMCSTFTRSCGGARDPIQLHVGEDQQVLFQARRKHPCAREGVYTSLGPVNSAATRKNEPK